MSATSLSRRAYRRAVAKSRGEYFSTSGSNRDTSPPRTAAMSSASVGSMPGKYAKQAGQSQNTGREQARNAAPDFGTARLSPSDPECLLETGGEFSHRRRNLGRLIHQGGQHLFGHLRL